MEPDTEDIAHVVLDRDSRDVGLEEDEEQIVPPSRLVAGLLPRGGDPSIRLLGPNELLGP